MSNSAAIDSRDSERICARGIQVGDLEASDAGVQISYHFLPEWEWEILALYEEPSKVII